MKNYFEKQVNSANETFMGADAFKGADGFKQNDYGFTSQKNLNAGGDDNPAPVQRSQESQPYIITVLASTTADVSNVEILNSNVRQLAPTLSGITFGYRPSVVSYAQFLAQISAGAAFECGKVRLIASSTTTTDAQKQVLEEITIKTVDLNGNLAQMTIIPTLDNYQFTQVQADITTPFMVNGMTSFVVNTVYAGVLLKIYLYPSKKINALKALDQNQGVTGYSKPIVNAIVDKN